MATSLHALLFHSSHSSLLHDYHTLSEVALVLHVARSQVQYDSYTSSVPTLMDDLQLLACKPWCSNPPYPVKYSIGFTWIQSE
jgi:hypothetical protein